MSEDLQNIDYNQEANNVEQSDESKVHIDIPFDPNLIRIRQDPFTLGQLIDKIEHDEINFITNFQRKADLWDAMKQSRLIESVLLKLPLPSFYFDEVIRENPRTKENEYIWQVIDGLQRCSVLRNFVVKKNMHLTDLEFLTKYNGAPYDKLPRELQRRIMQTPISVYVVEKGTPEDVKFNIFRRINTGGLILTPQEIRHALNQGVASEYVARLAELKIFKEATCGIIKTERMEDRDFVTRYISFYLVPYKDYKPDLDTFMSGAMRIIESSDMEKMKIDFEKSMRTASQIFANDAFRKRKLKDAKRGPINKALFEVLSVTFAKLNDDETKSLINNKELFINKFIKLNNDDTFLDSIGSGTGDRSRVIKRFSEIERIIKETISK